MGWTIVSTILAYLPSPRLTHVLLNDTSVASPPHVEARGVRWSGTQHAHEERHHPAARLNPEEHGQYWAAQACYFGCPLDREGNMSVGFD